MQNPNELPRGPWASDDAALAEIRLFAQDPTKGGGIWGVRFQAGLECGGKTRRIGCSAAHDDKREGLSNQKERSGFRCRWGITLQLRNGEWSSKTSRLEHSHELPQDAIRALNGQKSMRAGIPADFRPIGQAMQRSGIEASRIHNTLVINAQFSGRAITWTLNDIRHTFGITTQDRILDSSILHDWLKTRTSTRGLEGAILERAGRLSSCYFEMDGARELYQAAGDNTCVIFDTTFNTNRFGMRLFFFSTLTPNGLTKVNLHVNVTLMFVHFR